MPRRRKDDDLLGVLFLVYRETPWWVPLLVSAVVYGGLRLTPLAFPPENPLRLLGALFAPYAAVLVLLPALPAAWHKWRRRELVDRQRGLDTLREMTWREFEKLVGEAYRRQGYAVEETGGGGPDGGVDLILRRGGETVLVQCKHWKQKKVSSPTVRELRGAVARDRATRGIFVTLGDFTEDARAEALKQPPVELVNGAALLLLIQGVQQGAQAPGRQTSVPTAAAAVPIVEAAAPDAPPTCPVCARPMRKKMAGRGPNQGNEFWGCPAFPNCRGTRPLN